MLSTGHSDLAPLPEGVPSDLAEHYDYATRFLISYRSILECLPSTYFGGQYLAPSEEVLNQLIDTWNSISGLMKYSAYHLFPVDFLDEVLAARKEYTGDFNPKAISDFWGEGISVDYTFKSAFHFVQNLSGELLGSVCNTGDYDTLKKLARSELNNRISIIELQPRPESDVQEYDLEVAYFQGSLERLRYVSEPEIISEELRREVLAVTKKRSNGTSWQAIGDSLSPDSVMTKGEVLKKLGSIGAVKMVILRGLLECAAIGRENSVSAARLSEKTKMENDSTFKSQLSWLRDMRLVGGTKGQRGYWIDEQCRDALQLFQDKVTDKVTN